MITKEEYLERRRELELRGVENGKAHDEACAIENARHHTAADAESELHRVRMNELRAESRRRRSELMEERYRLELEWARAKELATEDCDLNGGRLERQMR